MSFRIVVSDPETGEANQIESDAKELIGKRVGDTIELNGEEVLITGGSDKDGFPMRGDLSGSKRRKILTVGGTGHRKREKGQRKRKMVRGREISTDITQINVKLVK
jgi:small subunit ribosomal protein S6e